MVEIGNEWDTLLEEEFAQEYYRQLRDFLKDEYKNGPVYPPMCDIFNALKYTSYSDVKIVILGQDPYHGAGQAHGMCFSVRPGVPMPPSLQNIFKELHEDIGIFTPPNGCLIPWAREGVLLLNTVLTVREGQPNSHRNQGWETLTDRVISLLGQREEPVVFLLWGSNARKKKELITAPQHLILECAHPSPLSAHRGFFGCQHFSKANQFLYDHGIEPVDWNVVNSKPVE
jgi:uracil-DNA glycosylase